MFRFALYLQNTRIADFITKSVMVILDLIIRVSFVYPYHVRIFFISCYVFFCIFLFIYIIDIFVYLYYIHIIFRIISYFNYFSHCIRAISNITGSRLPLFLTWSTCFLACFRQYITSFALGWKWNDLNPEAWQNYDRYCFMLFINEESIWKVALQNCRQKSVHDFW